MPRKLAAASDPASHAQFRRESDPEGGENGEVHDPDEVTPKMADLLGLPRYDPQDQDERGFLRASLATRLDERETRVRTASADLPARVSGRSGGDGGRLLRPP